MKKIILLLSINICFINMYIHSQNNSPHYGAYNLFADINFNAGNASDLQNNLQTKDNGLTYSYDDERKSVVANFAAAQKTNLQLTTYPFEEQTTLSFWFKREDANPDLKWGMLFSFYGVDKTNIFFTPFTNWSTAYSYIVSDCPPYGDYRSGGVPLIQNKKWTHVAIVFNKTEWSLYTDGVYRSTMIAMGSLPDFKTTLNYFGNNPNLNFPMSGSLDDIKIYHSSLTANQINAIANNLETLPKPIYDSSKPYAYIDFKNGISDSQGNVSDLTVKSVTKTYISDGREGGSFDSNSYITLNEDPIGTDKYTYAFVYKKNKFSTEDKDKVLFKFTCDNGDFIALYNRYTPETGAKLEVVKRESGVTSNLGLTTQTLKEKEVNSIVFVQTYTTNNGAYKLYINGSTTAKVGLAFYSKNFDFTKWTVGSEVSGETESGEYSGISFYRRELAATDIKLYHKFNKESISLSVDPTKKYQTIRNFGASDGWNAQYAGLYLNDNQKERVAELLFSTDDDDTGNPKGIGLSAWRFNIGAGTSEQGTNSRIKDETRRTECFLQMDGTYNWNKQMGQQYFLEKAVKTYHVPDIIGWQNSPPVIYTKKNLGFLDYGLPNETILKPEHFDDFGEFLANVSLHFKEKGIKFKYISPLNEPQYTWCPGAEGAIAGQEGCPWTNKNIYDVCKSIDKAFQKKGVDTKLFISEAGVLDHWLTSLDNWADNQFATFFNPTSPMSLLNTPSVSKIASSHSYWRERNASELVNVRRNMATTIANLYPEFEYWQTEYCFNSAFTWGHADNVPFTPAMSAVSLSRVIHADLVHGNSAAWQWWTTFEQNRSMSSGWERFALIRLSIAGDKSKAIYSPTKLLYGLGNYSRFIRPGMKRIELTRSDNVDAYTEVTNEFFSAYMDEITGRIVIVATNLTQSESGIILPRIDLGTLGIIEKYIPYATTNDLEVNISRQQDVQNGAFYVLPKTSITTFVGIPQQSGYDPVVKTNRVKVINNSAERKVLVQSDTKIQDVTLYDIFGRTVKVKPIDNEVGEISVLECSPGTYLLHITLADCIEVHKICVE